MSRLPKICAYCGSPDVTSRDHVPPDDLFPDPKPSDLITVPCCAGCHADTSKDDENFRLRLCLSEQVGDHPDAAANRDIVFRSLHRREAERLKHSFLNDIRPVSVFSQGGIFIGQQTGYNAELARIYRVVSRTVRGLFFFETHRVLRKDYDAEVFCNDRLSAQPASDLETLQQTILIPLTQIQPKVIGNNVFSYRVHLDTTDPDLSVWALLFYGGVPFLVFTWPRRSINR
jgi:hypothetical protein